MDMPVVNADCLLPGFPLGPGICVISKKKNLHESSFSNLDLSDGTVRCAKGKLRIYVNMDEGRVNITCQEWE